MLHLKPRQQSRRDLQGTPASHDGSEETVSPKAAWQPDFERLLNEHQSMVFSLAWRMTGDRGLAEEIAQDVFLELDRNLAKIESPEHALHWLRRVAMNR